jgi:DNA polymerase-3 subunit delta
VASVYLITGEPFLAEEALAEVRAATGADPLSEASFDASAAVHELEGALLTPSLLGGRRLVVVRGAHDLNQDQAEALARYIEAPLEGTVLVLMASGRTKLDAKVKRAGEVIALQAPKGRALVEWLRQRAGAAGLSLDQGAAWALIDAVGSELRDLDAALGQLLTALGAGSKVNAAAVKRAFPRLADERIYALTDALGERRPPETLVALRRLLDQGEEPLVILGALSSQVRRMLRVRQQAERGPGAVTEALGLPSWRAERLTKQARSYREDELARALGALAECDLEMKGGDLPAPAALERAVVRILRGEGPSRPS